MRFDVLTLHPEMVTGPLSASILGRAVERGRIHIGIHDIREHGLGRHRSVDDAPYGGGAGMVLRVDVVVAALEAVAVEHAHKILLSPQGRPFTQQEARRLAEQDHLIFVCGHYEGIDARIEPYVDEIVSLGDFVVTGGEIAAVVVIDAVARLVPGVLGNAASAEEESFSEGRLEYPQYTRPRSFRGHEVPEILLSGHHAQIEAWRRAQSEERTRLRRPDLLRSDPSRPDLLCPGVDVGGSDE
ncbi:MAG TPA: tRNA (guanosine(37)-N1)-methyltransferase TrmD [Deltaproteobacteria bacterium]|nr:tRNA (guanosine(37)-N1)-methyltransferase TrmD [Deltaproteobacteria bacterium]